MKNVRWAFVVLTILPLLASCSRLSNESLRQQFSGHRAEFTMLVAMSNQDADYIRITPTSMMNKNFVSYPDQQGNSGLSSDRWHAYRQLFRDASLQLGLERYSTGDVYLMTDRTGRFGHYTTWGYLYCAHTNPVGNDSPPPCRTSQSNGSEPAPDNESQPIFFEKLDNQWYLYKEGATN